jgi:UDP-N-acetyl-D-mannosaminuronic acid transferase (WecB/TagA/CpsF family)
MKFRSVGDELLHADGMKLIAALRSFANAPKTHSVNVVQGNNLCSEIHTKHRNTLYGQNVEFVNVKQV